MAASQRAGSIEFLEFLADISHPATGEISLERLATWLSQTAGDLVALWRRRGGHVSWSIFADEILSVLDAAQDETCDLMATVEWYLQCPLDAFEGLTPQEVVIKGQARLLVILLRSGRVIIGRQAIRSTDAVE